MEVVTVLLEAGADKENADNKGWVPLHTASRNGHVEVNVLLETGAHKDRAGYEGPVPLHASSLSVLLEAQTKKT